MKIAINRCWGGFELSKAVYKELGIEYDGYGYLENEDLGIESDDHNAYRADPRLIKAIEKLGEERASGRLARVVIVDIPDDVKWEIGDYDGQESVHEKHRSW